MDIEIRKKDNKIEFLVKKIGLADCQAIEEMNRLGLNKIPFKRKGDRIMDRLNKLRINQKFNKNEKQ